MRQISSKFGLHSDRLRRSNDQTMGRTKGTMRSSTQGPSWGYHFHCYISGWEACSLCWCVFRSFSFLRPLGDDQRIALWDLGSSKKIFSYQAHSDLITSLSFSQNSAVLASSGLDGTVRLWDVKQDRGSGAEERSLR